MERDFNLGQQDILRGDCVDLWILQNGLVCENQNTTQSNIDLYIEIL